MATNLAIDPALLDQALALSGERTKKAAVTMALQEFIARREQRRVLELMGKLDWDDTYDYKVERSRCGAMRRSRALRYARSSMHCPERK
jgi:hypothetical protein